MTKLIYPNEGINALCSKSLSTCENDLSGAVSSSNYSVPYGFNYRSYLVGLKTTLNDYLSEIKSITNKVQYTSKKYEITTNDLVSMDKNIEYFDTKERDRMI